MILVAPRTRLLKSERGSERGDDMLHYQTFRNKIRFVGIEWLVKEGTCIHKMLMLMTHLKLLNGS